MRAVNLIPAADRRGAGGAAGRSGGAVYILLGGLAVLVLMMSAFVLSGRSLDDKRKELVQVKRDADVATAKAEQLAPYTRFAALRQARVQTVRSLASTRFDWAHSLHEIARVIPENAWLTSVVGTVAPGVRLDGGGGGSTGSLRTSQAVPAIEFSGCTTSQSSVAKMMARLRLIDGVQRVSLASSEKADVDTGSGASSGGGSASGGDCRQGSDRFPHFEMVIFYQALAGASQPVQPGQPAAAQGGTGQPAAGAPAASGTTTTGQPAANAASTQGGQQPSAPAAPASTSQPASGGTTP